MRAQRIDARRRAPHQIRDPKPPFGQTHIVGRADWLRNEPRLEQQLPEAIRIAGEMMTEPSGTHAGIDADKQHAQTGLGAIR
jgi:hypothetical protein